MAGLSNIFGSPGHGPGGGFPNNANTGEQYASYGAPGSFVSLLPLFGGSGGAGAPQVFNSGTTLAGDPGAGGGGAIVLASTTKITIAGTGKISANGGDEPRCPQTSGGSTNAGVGSGGAIRLVAPQLTNQGLVTANGGRITFNCTATGLVGRIRAEAFVFGPFASTSPAASLVNQPGPVTSASTPALVNLPTLAFTSVGGVAPPAAPAGWVAR